MFLFIYSKYDPAIAPRVSHPEPGGLSTRDILQIISNIEIDVVGANIVEYNPKKDLKLYEK